jgi:PAS domain S-box-containing protein
VQKQYQILFESSSDAVYIHPFVKNGYGNFIDVNILACKSLGYTKEELLQMNVKDIIGDKSKYRIKTINREDFEITKEQIFESVHKRKDGTNFPVEINSKIVEMNGRKIIISNVRDITVRKRAEESLKESEERFALAIKAAEEGVWDWETNSDFVNYSDQWKAQLGYEPHELENSFSTWENLLHPEDHDRMIKEVQNYLENPVGFFIAEFRLRHKVGSYVWIRNKATCVKNKNGKVKRLVGAHTDITETKLWENALKESEEKYRLLVNNIPDYIYLIDRDMYVKSSNTAAQTIFKSRFKKIDGRHLSELFPKELYEEYKSNLEMVFDEKKPFKGESTLIANGIESFINVILNPVFDKNGEVQSVIGISRDITERKLAEEALLESEERFRSIFNTSDDPILILSLQSGSIPIIKDMNEVVCRKYKFNRKDLIGKKYRICFRIFHYLILKNMFKDFKKVKL